MASPTSRQLLPLIGGICLFAAVMPRRLIAQPPANPIDKIDFSLGEIDAEGLMGSGSGKRSRAYEFCIPAPKKAVVENIDPSVRFSNSPGRIKCSAEELLCIGETHQPRWQAKLFSLARLPYVKRIAPHWGE